MEDFFELPQTGMMVLAGGHSMLLNHVPPAVTNPVATKDYERYLAGSNRDLASFGLFTSPDYNTFYPEVSQVDLVGEDGDYIEPTFRMLTKAIVAKKHNPTDFSDGNVLKDSMHLLIGQSVYCDHDDAVGNALGSVKEVLWQESFTQGGVVVPAGINAVLKIDGKANPRIARGIMMDPPSIHSNSVTVVFEWKPSHTFEDHWAFYEKMGTYHEDGTMVRRIVTKIINYHETSLVSHGADSFAQKIREDGKLQNIAHAASEYYGKVATSSNSNKPIKTKEELVNQMFHFSDFKDANNLETGVAIMHNTASFNNEGEGITPKKTQPNTLTKQNKMDQELLNLVTSLLGSNILQLKDGEVAEKLTMVDLQTKLTEQFKAIVQREEASKAACATELEKYKAEATIGREHLSAVRASAEASYRKTCQVGGIDEAIISLISAETTGLETLIALQSQYTKSLELKFPLHCSDCGSEKVTRGSSEVEKNEDVQENSADDSKGTTLGQQFNNLAFTALNKK